MAINLVKLSGRPTLYNPIGSSTTLISILDIGEFVLTFKISNLNGSTFRIGGDNNNLKVEGLAPYDFSKDGSYSLKLVNTTKQNLYFNNINSLQGVQITDIQLVQKPLGVATINGVDGFGKVLLGDGSLKTVSNFAGKVRGSVVENGNIARFSNGTSSLVTPGSGTEFGISSAQYTGITTQDTSNAVINAVSNGNTAQSLFSFDVIRILEDKYGKGIWNGTTTLADKIARAKAITSSLTANWYGCGSNVLSNPTYTTDFASKVSGSTVENPNKAYWGEKSTLNLATATWSESNNITGSRVDIKQAYATDGSYYRYDTSVNGNIAQLMFSFNLIEHVKRKYGYTPDVAWLKDNIKVLQLHWFGYGSGPNGNKVSVARWHDVNKVWFTGTTDYHTNGTVTQVNPAMQSGYSVSITDAIDANGFIHFLAYADASDGVTASNVVTDYVSLDVTLNAGGNKANLVTWVPVGNAWDNSITSNTANAPTKSSVNVPSSAIASRLDSNGFVHFLAYADPSNGIAASSIYTDYIELELVVWENILVDSPWNFHDNAQLVDAETMVLNATGNFQTTLIMVPAKGGDTVTFSLGEGSTSGAYLQLTPKNSSQAGILSPTVVYAGQSKTVTAPVGTVQWEVALSNNQGAKQYIFKQPMLNLGSTPAPYEPKKGDRMVMPVPVKNLFNKDLVRLENKTGGGAKDGSLTLFTYWGTNSQRVITNVIIPVKPSGTYTLSGLPSGMSFAYAGANAGGGVIFDSGWLSSNTFTVPSNVYSVAFVFKYLDEHAFSTFDYTQIQIEEGTTATPFVPYSVQGNKKVKKLVPKKNLFDGILDAGGIVAASGVDDSTTTGTLSRSRNYLPIKSNTIYTISKARYVIFYDSNKTYISSANGLTTLDSVTPYLFTTPSNCAYLRFSLLGTDLSTLVQIEEGSVATPYEPYTQVLPKAPQGLRFNGVTDFIQGAYLPSIEFTKSFALEGEFMIDRIPTIGTHALFQNSNASSRIALSVTTQGHLSLSYFDGTIWTGKSGIVPLNQRVKYLATCTNGVLTMSINGVDQTGTSTGYSGIDSSRFTIGQATTNQSNNSFLGIMYSFKATDLIANQTLLNYDFTNPNNIVGNTVLPVGKSITGMNFNGTSDYLQIPALTMDAIEIDCVIDSSQSASAMFLDARNGLSNGHITIDGNGGGWTDLQVDGVPTSITSGIGLVPKNKRVKIKLNAINSFTDDVTIFGKWDTTGNKVKGTIYKVNFYLNGKVIYSLDLENKFYPSQNLIPDFEDSRWVFHPNTQVIGKDVLRLNSTAFGQMSTYKIDLMANQSYYLQVTTNSDRSYLAFYDVNDVEILPRQNIYNTGFKSTFTTASNVSYGILSMYAQVNGSYDFIRPQLYVLDGKQGTINGSPVKQLDSAKRKLYAKR